MSSMPYSIIITYETNIDKDYDKLNNKIKKLLDLPNDFVYTSAKIYMLHDGKIYNPPHYSNIVIVDDEWKLPEKDLIMVFNMLHQFGHLIISTKYKKFFELIGVNHIKKINLFDNYVVYKKKTNLVLKNPRVPVDFIIMGTQKSGTTTAQKILGLHPDIYLHKDEVHYFDLFLSKGLQWYKSHFDYSKKIVGEKTPELMYLEWTLPYIQLLNPSLKIILFLRNPIHRAYSAWKMMKYDHGETLSFEECINEELTKRLGENKNFNTASFHHLQRGLYWAQISNILKWFPRENLLVLLFENVIKNPDTEYKKIYDFLQVDEIKQNYSKERPGGDDSVISEDLYNKLVPFFQNDVDQLEIFLGYKTNWF